MEALAKAVTEAIHKFAQRVSIPILYSTPAQKDKIHQIGTGTLFEYKDRYFLVTAAHVIENMTPENLSIPRNPLSDLDLRSLGTADIFRPNAKFPEVDIAVIELLDRKFVEEIKSAWKVLTIANAHHAPETGVFVICGYPGVLGKAKDDSIKVEAYTLFTQRILNTPTNARAPVVPGLDLFFSHSQIMTWVDGRKTESPRLEGISGSSVWQYTDTSGLWTPEKGMKIIGIQTSVLHNEFVRAKNWKYVRSILEKIISQP